MMAMAAINLSRPPSSTLFGFRKFDLHTDQLLLHLIFILLDTPLLHPALPKQPWLWPGFCLLQLRSSF